MQRVREDLCIGLSRASPWHPNHPGETRKRVEFSNHRATLERLVNSPQFCDAAAKFQRRHPQDEDHWYEFITAAVHFPSAFLAEDRRTNAQKADYVAKVLRGVEELWNLISPDFVLTADEGAIEPAPNIRDVTAHSRLDTLANVRSSVLHLYLLSDPDRSIDRVNRVQGTFTPHHLASIAEHLIEPLKQELQRLQRTPDAQQVNKGYAPESYGLARLDMVFRPPSQDTNKPKRIFGIDGLIVSTINSVLNRNEQSALTLRMLEGMRRHRKKALANSSTEQT
jgi:hypothetical protein